MIKLLRYIKGYEKQAIIAPLFKMLEASFELIVPLVMASMIDVGVREQNMNHIWKMGAILIFLGVLGLTCSVIAQFFSAKAAVGFGTALREDLFQHINEFSYSELDQVGTATLITRMTSDVNQVQGGVNMVLRLLLRSPFIVVGALIMAFTVSFRLAIIFVIAVPILALIIYGTMLISIPLYKKVQKALDQILQSTRENIVGIRVVRAFRTQEKEKEEFAEENRAFLTFQMMVGRLSALLNPLTYVIVNAATIAIVWYGGKEVYFGNLTQGEVIALVNYMTQILTALVALSILIVSFTKAIASASRINDLFAMTSTMEDGEKEGFAPQDVMVSFQNVGFTYQGAKEEALSHITFDVKRGETIGIIGGTGSGKSTLVNLIPRFYDITTGKLCVAGEEVNQYQMEELRKRIGVVPQKSVLFKGTLRENMKFGNEAATDEQIWKALEIAQATEIVNQKGEGLDVKITQSGKNLSGGQKQRFAIARALVKEPDILILDDSASALDFATDAKLRKAIEEHTDGMTVFIVSQRAASIMHADKIIVLDDGEMVGIGTHEELLRSCEVYKEICSSQLSKEEVAKYVS